MVTKKGAQASACLHQGEADQTIKSHAREGENKGYCEIMSMMYNELDPGMMGLAVKEVNVAEQKMVIRRMTLVVFHTFIGKL